jgi:hypothetical protein
MRSVPRFDIVILNNNLGLCDFTNLPAGNRHKLWLLFIVANLQNLPAGK